MSQPTFAVPTDANVPGGGNPAQNANQLSDIEGLLLSITAAATGFTPAPNVPGDNATNLANVVSLLGQGGGSVTSPNGIFLYAGGGGAG